MKAGKWNRQTHEYDPYDLPEGAAMMALDMDELVRCAECGKEIQFGRTYTSMLIHNQHGIGYAVCPECYSKEWEDEE